jgi:hypothetical protein
VKLAACLDAFETFCHDAGASLGKGGLS